MDINCTLPTDHEFQKLDLLLSQGQFELVSYDPSLKKQDLKLVYLMNDAVESFLIFQAARLTGEYLPDFEGELSASLSRDEHGYILIVHQNTVICTLFFRTCFWILIYLTMEKLVTSGYLVMNICVN